MKKSLLILYVLSVAALTLSRAAETFAATAPYISQLSPASGLAGSSVTVIGSGFTALGNSLSLNGTIIANNLQSSDGATLVFVVTSCPYTAPQCPGNTLTGAASVVVTNTNGTSNTATFTVTSGLPSPAPIISQISPSSGAIGSQVQVIGSGFLSAGVKVNFDVGPVVTNFIDDSHLTFMVPSQVTGGCQPPLMCPNFIKQISPGSSYNVTVSNANGISNTATFLVTGPGFITPADGSLIQITGSLTVYLVQNGMLHPFTSAAAFFARGLSWANVQVYSAGQINPQTISSIPVTLPDGSIMKGSTPTVFIVFGAKKYGITSLDTFYRLGLSFNNLVMVSDNKLQTYPDGGIY